MESVGYREVQQEIVRGLGFPSRGYLAVLVVLAAGVGAGVLAFGYQVTRGMGVTGLAVPVCWGTYITNFVFWIGVGHAGTLISAILYLVRVDWRTSVARAAETMTVFAVMTAALFPLIHLGRVWVFYWILPYPNQAHLWPNFKSPLVFDVVAVTTYLTVSIIFWYVGLIPDLAAIRDATDGLRRRLYGVAALGWTGEGGQWRHYLRAYTCLAALATPLVISVHSVVSWDFALAHLPGWHETIFPPYFVAGAIHSGLAMVIMLLVPLRVVFRLERLVQVRHFAAMAQLMVLTGLIVGYAYAVEPFMAWFSGDRFERAMVGYRAAGTYAPYFWVMTAFNAVLPLAFFWKRARTDLVILFAIAALVNVGMWIERFVIIVTSLAHGYLPSSWFGYAPRPVEITISVGAGCFFLFMLLACFKLVPAISVAESKAESGV
jgi:Ni/Fe-hydrogenase subunit HybB-like protein